MGLDVVGWKKVEYLGKTLDDKEQDNIVYVEQSGFDKQFGDLKTGYYKGESEHFCSMSYSGYNQFRNTLAEMAGWPPFDFEKTDVPSYLGISVKDKPHWVSAVMADEKKQRGAFYEMLNFSDCEGFICKKICKKLYQNFYEYDARAQVSLSAVDYRFFRGFKKAILFASKNGFIQFT